MEKLITALPRFQNQKIPFLGIVIDGVPVLDRSLDQIDDYFKEWFDELACDGPTVRREVEVLVAQGTMLLGECSPYGSCSSIDIHEYGSVSVTITSIEHGNINMRFSVDYDL